MKKRIYILGAVTLALGLTAFSFVNQYQSNSEEEAVGSCQAPDEVELEPFASEDFALDLGTRFLGVKKEELNQASSVEDFLHHEPIESVVSYESVEVMIVKDDQEADIGFVNADDALTVDQKSMLQSFEISTNFYVKAIYFQRNQYTGELQRNYFKPYFTVIPEHEANYEYGTDGLLQYFRKRGERHFEAINYDKLQPGKLFFTVTTEGTVSNARIVNSSGYGQLDQKMIELTMAMPGKWEPARNSSGQNVEQELVLSYGLAGC